MTPALVAGAMLTLALDAAGAGPLIAGTWLALYGAGVTAGGTHSAQDFRWMGICFIILGGVAFLRPEYNLALLANAGSLRETLGLPVLVGPSRKRFLGSLTGDPVECRDAATAVACAVAIFAGADAVRVHDVAGAVRAAAVAGALRDARREAIA